MSIVQSCFDVADYFIQLANQTSSPINNLKLQKLVYYAQAWHLAIHAAPLFEEDFQAWIHGPVVPQLYQKYKIFGWQPIQESVDLTLSKDVLSFLDEVAEAYFTCDVNELEQMTRIETPWNQARGNLPPDALIQSLQKSGCRSITAHVSKKIQKTKLKPSPGISFSFKYFQDHHSKFS
jgi:uncharacterized phage-associated protein